MKKTSALLVLSFISVFAMADSKYATNTLSEYSMMLGVNDICKTKGIDNTKKIEEYLTSKIETAEIRIKSINNKIAKGKFVYPTEKGDAEMLEAALPELKNKAVNTEAFEAGKKSTSAENEETISKMCKSGLKTAIENSILQDVWMQNVAKMK